MAQILMPLSSYEPWSGASETYKTIEEASKLDELDELIEKLYPNGIDETTLNDFLWFDADFIFKSLKIETGPT
ncbi:MAG: hypothetical protein FWD27_00540 [Coriobacteriia bacterium]|nr:hypothetical protein [Coriobacteriia bacterium]